MITIGRTEMIKEIISLFKNIEVAEKFTSNIKYNSFCPICRKGRNPCMMKQHEKWKWILICDKCGLEITISVKEKKEC